MQIDRQDGQTAYFTITVDGDDCQFEAVVPVGEDAEKFLAENESQYRLIVLKHLYPESAGTPRQIYYGQLEDFEAWITDGCHVSAVIEDGVEALPARTVTKVPWAYTHPAMQRIIDGELISGDTLAAMDKAIEKYPDLAVFKTILRGDA